jgi:hypothetical protein
MPIVETQQSYRLLWAQVVLQAKADLENEPIGSIIFNQAAAFFVSRGEWAESRLVVADCLDMHPDDLKRCGERWIADRRRREGLPPEPEKTVRPVGTRPLPRLVASPARGKIGRKARPASSGNPFEPRREQAAAAG